MSEDSFLTPSTSQKDEAAKTEEVERTGGKVKESLCKAPRGIPHTEGVPFDGLHVLWPWFLTHFIQSAFCIDHRRRVHRQLLSGQQGISSESSRSLSLSYS
ncbi:MAG: hypothetical protein JRF30_02090 [Deltaproteobacteria bacterium]|nr:hypothetical protein [Deltaproteobacteria bacterium]MBW1793953.1 hypothetical protein [Deltaproteobacteria bacterium]MBW2329731.1 hypothetical protein [Deltaproteobacteria bacterium]